jgi:hypothetical protein
MTIAQDKYCVIDTNADGSKTLKAIIEFLDVDGTETAFGFSFHNDTRTAVISRLPGLGYSLNARMDTMPNLAWQKYLQPAGVNPNEVNWTYHTIYSSRLDLRHPYRGIDPYNGKPEIFYEPMEMPWIDGKFEQSELGDLLGRHITDKERLQFFQTYFGTLEELTDRFNWRKGANRLDIEYKIEKVNEDGSTILKTIYFWEHPDYPAHCMVRIWARATDAIVIITSLQSNIPPEQDNIHYEYKASNYVGNFLPQVIEGIQIKYSYLLDKYCVFSVLWIFESQISLGFDEEVGYNSSMYFICSLVNESGRVELHKKYIHKKEELQIQALFASKYLGNAFESLDELGWLNR